MKCPCPQNNIGAALNADLHFAVGRDGGREHEM
jgi:hypothetical protein